jgi:hypothetical protein
MKDYGYGVNYDWSYGLNTRYFFDYFFNYTMDPIIKVEAVKPEVTVVVVDKTDLLCTYWDDEKCISCSGDYYADDSGRCVKVDNECEYWKVSGICDRCSYGWIVGSEGRCVAQAAAKPK